MNLHFNQRGFNYFTGSVTLPTTFSEGGEVKPAIYYGIVAETAFTPSASSTFAKGYAGDTNWLGVEHPAGTYLMRFSKLVISAGTGIALIE